MLEPVFPYRRLSSRGHTTPGFMILYSRRCIAVWLLFPIMKCWPNLMTPYAATTANEFKLTHGIKHPTLTIHSFIQEHSKIYNAYCCFMTSLYTIIKYPPNPNIENCETLWRIYNHSNMFTSVISFILFWDALEAIKCHKTSYRTDTTFDCLRHMTNKIIMQR